MKLKTAVIFGGRSGEHEVSLVSATSIIKALDPKKYEVIQIGISKNGAWLAGKNVLASFKSGKKQNLRNVTLSFDHKKRGILVCGAKHCKFKKIDFAFVVLHGPYGEDGTIQGLFEMAGIPYTGCGVLASAVAMDKLTSKLIFKTYGLRQTEFLNFSRAQIKNDPHKIKELVAKHIGFPCFVKPSNMGSSVGISKVKQASGLQKALLEAAKFDSSILVERAVNARELECAVLGNESPMVSTIGEIVPNREFYDYHSKYVDNKSGLFIPAKISAKKTKEAQELAKKAYQALQCSGMARVDFLMDKKTSALYINELNTIPGFTSISMYPKLFGASGISYPKLLDKLIDLGIKRFREKQKNKVSFESGSQWYM